MNDSWQLRAQKKNFLEKKSPYIVRCDSIWVYPLKNSNVENWYLYFRVQSIQLSRQFGHSVCPVSSFFFSRLVLQ